MNQGCTDHFTRRRGRETEVSRGRSVRVHDLPEGHSSRSTLGPFSRVNSTPRSCQFLPARALQALAAGPHHSCLMGYKKLARFDARNVQSLVSRFKSRLAIALAATFPRRTMYRFVVQTKGKVCTRPVPIQNPT